MNVASQMLPAKCCCSSQMLPGAALAGNISEQHALLHGCLDMVRVDTWDRKPLFSCASVHAAFNNLTNIWRGLPVAGAAFDL